MKKVLKISGIVLLAIIVIIVIIGLVIYVKKSNKINENYALLGEEAKEISIGSKVFRDLNKNGKLDIYEDSGASIEDRVNDLIGQMKKRQEPCS